MKGTFKKITWIQWIGSGNELSKCLIPFISTVNINRDTNRVSTGSRRKKQWFSSRGILTPRDIWQCLEIVSVFTTQGRCYWPRSPSGYREARETDKHPTCTEHCTPRQGMISTAAKKSQSVLWTVLFWTRMHSKHLTWLRGCRRKINCKDLRWVRFKVFSSLFSHRHPRAEGSAQEGYPSKWSRDAQDERIWDMSTGCSNKNAFWRRWRGRVRSEVTAQQLQQWRKVKQRLRK